MCFSWELLCRALLGRQRHSGQPTPSRRKGSLPVTRLPRSQLASWPHGIVNKAGVCPFYLSLTLWHRAGGRPSRFLQFSPPGTGMEGMPIMQTHDGGWREQASCAHTHEAGPRPPPGPWQGSTPSAVHPPPRAWGWDSPCPSLGFRFPIYK